MPQSKQARRSGRGTISPPLSKPDRIVDLLTIQTETFPQKALSSGEIERWKEDLDAYPLAAIEWAFENWRKNGQFFPVPNDILDQCKAWAPGGTHKTCDAECKSRHGKGYGEADMMYLWERYSQKRSEVNRTLTDNEVEALMLDLDKKRGVVPDFRPMW